MNKKNDQLTDEQYQVCFLKGTEPPFSGKYLHNKEAGYYYCVNCHAELFSSDDKYDSGSGWPSYTKPSQADAVKEIKDTSHGMVRTEIVCSNCGAHLGHVFNDGPVLTGLRYCINSLALAFEKKET